MPLIVNPKTFFSQFGHDAGPRLECPFCGYNDTPAGFEPYNHPHEPNKIDTGSALCLNCRAAGHTALFILAANPTIGIGPDEEYREIFLADLAAITKKERVKDGKEENGRGKGHRLLGELDAIPRG